MLEKTLFSSVYFSTPYRQSVSCKTKTDRMSLLLFQSPPKKAFSSST